MTIYDLCWILAPEDNGKHNQSESYTEKYQKRVCRIYGYKLLCVNDKFSKLFKSYLVKIMLWNLLIIWLKKANTVLMFENHFNKELVMT